MSFLTVLLPLFRLDLSLQFVFHLHACPAGIVFDSVFARFFKKSQSFLRTCNVSIVAPDLPSVHSASPRVISITPFRKCANCTLLRTLVSWLAF